MWSRSAGNRTVNILRRAVAPSGWFLALLTTTVLVAGCLRQEGPALVPGMQLCIGIPGNTCQEQVASLRQQKEVPLVAYRIVCTRPGGCTQQAGDATVDALYADGSVSGGGFGWAAAAPAP